MEWQPIETAPKDGTPVDIWVLFDDGYEERVSDAKFIGGIWRFFWINEGLFSWVPVIGKITHWMPLPEPPAKD